MDFYGRETTELHQMLQELDETSCYTFRYYLIGLKFNTAYIYVMIGYTGQVFKIIKLKAEQCSQILYSIHTIQGGLLIDNTKRGLLVILSSKYMVKDHSKRQCFSYNDVLNYLLANEMSTIISQKGTQYLMNVRQKTHTRNHIAPLKLFRENWEKKAENSKHYLRNLTRHNNKSNISNTVVYVSQ